MNKKLCYTAQWTAGPRLIYLFIGVCPVSTSGLGHFGSGQLVLGTNHFGHRHFPSLWVIPCEFRDDLYLSRNYNDFVT